MDVTQFLQTLALAKAHTSRQQWRDAVALWERVVEANPVHGTHWVNLAHARGQAGDLAGAAAAYERVLKLGAWHRDDTIFPGAVAYRLAGCAAGTGDRARALEWLQRARDLGYRDLHQAASDGDLAALRDDPQFREIVGMVEVEGHSRAEGWRADLRLLAREVKRRAYAPFRHTPERDFDAAVAALADAVAELTDAQIVVELHRLLRGLGDGHAFVALPEQRYDDVRRTLPLQLYWFQEGVFVTAADPEYERLVGAEMVALDGRPVEEVLEAVDPLISRDNAYGPRQQAPAFLCRPPFLHALGLVADPGRVTLSVRTFAGAGEQVEVTATGPAGSGRSQVLPCPDGWTWLPARLGSPLPRYLRHCGLPHWFEYLPDHATVYFQMNNVLDHPDQSLADCYRRLFALVDRERVERFVLDLRWNGGGNTFLAMPLLNQLVARDAINQRGRLFVIIGRKTFSAAQNLATLIGRHADPIYVGEPTGSSPTFVGETIPFPLPYSGLTVNVSDLLWQSSWPMDHRTWLPPDLYAPPTFEAYRRNQDPALDAVLAYPVERLPGW